MNTRKLINQTPVDEWELLNETVGRRPGPGTPLFEPHELGYACPVCDASDEVNITWSEFNGMIWCGNLIKRPALHNWCCPVCFNELRRPK
jgi:rubredoxin